MRTSLIVGAILTLVCLESASAKTMTDKEQMRQQAEHLCYDDVQRLCSSDIPDETKIAACMRSKRSKLSPACRKVFDAGMK